MLAFDDNEDEVAHSILPVLESGRKIYRFEENLLPSEISYGDLMILLDKRQVTCHGRRADLTFTEFEILQLLAQNPGQVFSKEQIYDIVWKKPYRGDYNIVMSHISHINSVDERKQYLRMKAGHVTYQIMTIFQILLAFVLALFRVEVWVIGMIFLLFIFQWAVGTMVYRILENRM